MRDYGKVHTSFWTSSNIRELSEDGRALAIYLLTCPHGTIAGVFRLPDGYACEDLQWDAERVKQTLSELLANGFATRCEATKWVWVTKHLEWNPPENPNQKKAAAKMAEQVPDSCSWKDSFIGKYGCFLGIQEDKTEPLANPLPTVPQPVTVTVAVTEAVINDGFALFWDAYPKKVAKPAAVKAFKAAKINGHLPEVLKDIESKSESAEWKKEKGQFIPYPATYLNERRWEDCTTTTSQGLGVFL